MSDIIISASAITDTSRVVAPANARKGYALEELYRLVGCEMVEIIPAPNGMILVVDEEGLHNRKPLNVAASRIAGRRIVGDALYCAAHHVR
jgi:hypothetical protein